MKKTFGKSETCRAPVGIAQRLRARESEGSGCEWAGRDGPSALRVIAN
jgi:hypothetical protein